MSLLSKYIGSFRAVEETTSSIPSTPRGMVKILMSLKVLTDLFGRSIDIGRYCVRNWIDCETIL